MSDTVAELTMLPVLNERPKTRGECIGGIRPCPHTACRYHLSDFRLSAEHKPGRKPTHARTEPEITETCALDVSDRGVTTLEEIGQMVNVTRERVRQIEAIALKKIRRRKWMLEPLSLFLELKDEKKRLFKVK